MSELNLEKESLTNKRMITCNGLTKDSFYRSTSWFLNNSHLAIKMEMEHHEEKQNGAIVGAKDGTKILQVEASQIQLKRVTRV